MPRPDDRLADTNAVRARSGAGDEPLDLRGWQPEPARVDRAGNVRLELRNGSRCVTLQLCPVGAHRRTLARTRFGDVSYSQALGISESGAARVARHFAMRLDTGASDLPAHFPHLVIAAADERPPGSCGPALTPLWPRELPRPAACESLRVDRDGVAQFLAPDLCLDAAPFAGFVLRSISVEPQAEPLACVLELQPSEHAHEPILIALTAAWSEGESFGAPQRISFTLRRGGVDERGDLLPHVARFCSLLAGLIELKQAAAFVVLPAQGRSESAPATGRPVVLAAHQRVAAFDTDIHQFAVLSSGFTVLRQVLPASEIPAIAAGVERALAAMKSAVDAGRDLAYTFYDKDTYLGTRCIYCWGEACTRLIESEVVRCMADAVIGPHRLFDMSAHRALAAAHLDAARTEEWHRDIDVFDDSPPSVRYLWFFIPLDEFTARNGATWVVPGSQRLPNTAVPPKGANQERFPTRVQLLGSPGDVFVVNPSALHTVGHNASARPRTMINLGVCHATIRPLLDHWAIAGPAIQAGATERLRSMLGAASEAPLDTTWSVLPEGWQTSQRSSEVDPSLRVFPLEQRGYQRSHRIRDDE